MYFIVKLKSSGQKQIIPMKWVQNLQIFRLLKYGVTYEKRHTYKIFVSNEMADEPDFALEVLAQIDKKRNACYQAHICHVFGKMTIESIR